MSRRLWFLSLLWGLLAAAPVVAGVDADSLATPPATAGRDTVRAGEWIIVGDTVSSGATRALEREQLKETLTQMGTREVPGLRRWQRQKVPKVALFSSAALPGLGQLYNGRRIKVGLAAGFFSVYLAGAWLNHKDAQAWTAYRNKLPEDAPVDVVNFTNRRIEFHKQTARDFVWWSAAIWVINMLDAWIDAHLFDLRAYTPPADVGGATDSADQAPGRSIHYLTYTVDF